MPWVTNFALFQAGWLACVLGAAHRVPWVGALAAVLVAAWHVLRAAQPARELALVAIAAVLGALFESALLHSGLVHYTSAGPIESIAPYWMVALWAIFATTLNLSLRWLHGHPALAALLGGVAAPLAYYSGARLGALEFPAPGAALAAIAAGWAVLTPALLAAARRLDGYAT